MTTHPLIRTTLTLRQATHRRLRVLAASRGITLNELLVSAILKAYPPPSKRTDEPKEK